MQIVKQGSPFRIVTEDRVSKSDDVTVFVGVDGELIQPGRRKAVPPDLSSLRNNVAVEVGASIVTTPTISVQGRNVIGVNLSSVAVLHNRSRFELAMA